MTMTPAPAPLPPEEIERLESLDAAATGAPWKALEGADHAIAISRNMPAGSMAVARLIGAVDTIYGKGPVVCISEEDRRLIVDMRNALPALLAEIEAGRAGAERVKELEAENARLSILADALRKCDCIQHKFALQDVDVAALRQAAQPSDGARRCSNCREPMLSDEDDLCGTCGWGNPPYAEGPK